MTTLVSGVPTERAARYAKQLVAHLSHRHDGEWAGPRGRVVFPDAVLRLESSSTTLFLTIEAESESGLATTRGVIERHLARFAPELQLVGSWAETGDGASGANDLLVEAVGLSKHYPAGNKNGAGFTAVKGIDFTLRRGEVFGFLGPNGAGKSSTMRMIACVSPVTSGTLRVLGMDPAACGRAIRRRLGVVAQDDALDTELTVYENLLIYGRYFGLRSAEVATKATQLLAFAQLADKAAVRVDALSGGMRRRLTIARSLVNDPDILLLDEPTTGLDPQARHVLWDRLFELKQRGVTIILTTHYMDEAEQLCDRLVVMDGGRIVAEGSPRRLIEAHASREVLELRFESTEHAVAVEKIEAAGLADRVEVVAGRILCSVKDGEAALADVDRLGVAPVSALVRRSSLEDVFLSLTGRTLVD